MIDWIPLINKISIPIIKKLISCFRNRPFVKVTAELGLKNGIHAVVINSNRNHISTVLNTDEEAIKIYCVNETSHRCFLDRLEIEFECGNIQRISLENVELVEGKKTSRDIAFDEETYSKVQDTGDNFVVSWPGIGRSEITVSKEKFYFKSFKDMYDQLLIYAVVTQGHPFEHREKECRKLLSEVGPGKIVYVFDCHL